MASESLWMIPSVVLPTLPWEEVAGGEVCIRLYDAFTVVS